MVDDEFYNLVNEVRNHRVGMGRNIAPSAPFDVDVLAIAYRLCDEDFYKSDYKDTTVKLISDSLTYDDVKNHYRELAETIFGIWGKKGCR